MLIYFACSAPRIMQSGSSLRSVRSWARRASNIDSAAWMAEFWSPKRLQMGQCWKQWSCPRRKLNPPSELRLAIKFFWRIDKLMFGFQVDGWTDRGWRLHHPNCWGGCKRLLVFHWNRRKQWQDCDCHSEEYVPVESSGRWTFCFCVSSGDSVSLVAECILVTVSNETLTTKKWQSLWTMTR